MHEATLEYHEKNAAVKAPGDDAASAGVSVLLPFVFHPGHRVLDIGAGSGRDMARLLSQGIDAYGIEPRDSMRHQAAAAHPDLKTRLRIRAPSSVARRLGWHPPLRCHHAHS